jgi:general secretion pathway protein I
MRARGFTLLEIMVSLAIVGGLLVTLIYSLNYHLSIASRHEFITTATLLARGKMAEVEKGQSTADGTFPEPFSSYHYTVATKDSPYPGIAQVDVTVDKDGEKVKLSELLEKKK